jgi:hypothetical protein
MQAFQKKIKLSIHLDFEKIKWIGKVPREFGPCTFFSSTYFYEIIIFKVKVKDQSPGKQDLIRENGLQIRTQHV